MEDIKNRVIENDPELQAIQEKFLALEAKLKPTVDDAAWELILEWESLWAEYAELCVTKLRPVSLRKAGEKDNEENEG